MPHDRRIQHLLMEINHHRRLWKAWNENGQIKRPSDENHFAITHMFLYERVKDVFFFRFIVRLYALLEEDAKKFTFGHWLQSLRPTPVVQAVQKKYKALIATNDFKKMLKNRHNTFVHNSLRPGNNPHSYSAVFQMSRELEGFYDEIVKDGQVQAVPWTGELDRKFVHISNCAGGIEKNVREFFEKLEGQEKDWST